MASSLTSTNLKSGFLYLFLFVFIAAGIVFFVVFDQSNSINNLQKKSMLINASALKNGIKFANIKFHLNQNKNTRLDLWISNGIGLDFNDQGFPIGTDILNIQQQHPISSDQCRQIWLFILGPLQPPLNLESNNNSYWTELNSNNTCSYRHSTHQLHINYQPLTGEVTILE